MKIKLNIRKVSIVTMLCVFSISSVKSQDILWKSTSGGTNNNYGTKSDIDSHNNVYIVGAFNGILNSPSPLTAKGGDDGLLMKYDSNGNLLWAKQIGGTSNDYALDVVISPDDEYIYVTGIFNGTAFADNLTLTSSNGADGFLAKYNKDGKIIYFKNIAQGQTTQRPQGIKLDKNNHLVIAGIFTSEAILGANGSSQTLSTSQALGMFVAQFDTTGLLLKTKQLESSNVASRLYTFDLDTSGYYIAGHYKGNFITDLGTYASNNGSLDMFVYKVDYNLNSKWVIKVTGTADDQIFSCSADNKGFLYFGGHFASTTMSIDSTTTGILSKKQAQNTTSNGNTDIFFAKYKYDGTLQWFNTAGSNGNDYLYRALYKNGNFIAAGQYGGTMTYNNKTITPRTAPDAFAIVQNQDDNLVYLMSMGGNGSDVGETAVVDNNGNFVVIGDYTSSRLYFTDNNYLDNSNAGTKDMFVVKYDKASLLKTVTPITCTGASTGEIDITPEGTVVPPFTFQWTKKEGGFSSDQQSITGLSAGTYRVTFTDAVGYQKKDSVVLTDPTPVSVALTSSSNVKCFNGANGAIDITPSGGTAPYTYAWTTVGGSGVNATAQDQTTLTAGTYNVSVTDVNGCSTTLTNIALTQPSKIIYKGTVVTKINGSTGSVNLAVQGGTPNYTFQWTGPSFTATTQNISGLTNAGNYLVNVTDANSCLSDTTVFVADSHVMNAYIGSKQDVLCNGQSTGSATIVVENAVAPVTYNWGGGRTQATETGLAAGTYTITVTDGTPSTATVILKISQPSSALSVSLAKTNITCYNANNGVLDANPAGGTLPYVYNWTKDGQAFDGGNETQINLAEGTYWVTATDANNCISSVSAVITNPAQISVNSAVITPVTCNGAKNDGAISLNVSGGSGTLGYRWSNGLATQNISLLSAGTYRCTITDANNCKTSTQQTVSQPDPITASFTRTNVLCFGGSDGAIDLTPSGGNPGGYTYVWSNAATTEDISGLTIGTYNVTITDSKNCKNTLSTTLTEPAYLILGASSIQNVNCFGAANGSINASTGGGTTPYVYQWSNGQFGSVATNLAPGTYSVTVTDGHNCQKSITYPAITEPTALTIAEVIGSHADELCNGGSIGALEVTSTGGSGSFEYSLDGLAWQTGSLFSNLAAGAYDVKVRDQNVPSCIKTISPAITITQPAAITFSSLVNKNITCFGLTNGEIDAVAAGGMGALAYTLKLNGTATGNTSGAASGQFTGLTAASNYTVEVTDANNCGPTTSNVLTVAEPQNLSFTSAVKKDITCFGLTNGEIDAVATGGTGALAYTLKLNGTATGNTSGAASGQFTGLAKATNYTLEVTDANNCGPVTSSALDITEPSAITITNEAYTKPTHAGLSDATLTITANGGTGTLQFSLNLGAYQNSGAFTGLPQGTYTVRVTDANNCGPVSSSAIQITDPTGLDLLKGGYLKIYPNPAIETAYLEINGASFPAITMEIQSLSGKTVKTFKWTDITSSFKEALDLSSLPKGVYLVRINNTVIKDKLVIQ